MCFNYSESGNSSTVFYKLNDVPYTARATPLHIVFNICVNEIRCVYFCSCPLSSSSVLLLSRDLNLFCVNYVLVAMFVCACPNSHTQHKIGSPKWKLDMRHKFGVCAEKHRNCKQMHTYRNAKMPNNWNVFAIHWMQISSPYSLVHREMFCHGDRHHRLVPICVSISNIAHTHTHTRAGVHSIKIQFEYDKYSCIHTCKAIIFHTRAKFECFFKGFATNNAIWVRCPLI